MKLLKVTAFSAAALLAAGLWTGTAEAQSRHRHHHRNHHLPFFALGALLAAPLIYAAPRYYYPAPAYSPPPVYIEPQPQLQPQLQPQSSSYWYYCQAAGAYYPHVQSCPGGWQRVAPQ